MKISIRLSVTEVWALVSLLERSLDFRNGNNNLTGALVNIVLLKFYRNLKLRSVFVEKPLKVKFEQETALAFIEFFTTHEVYVTDYEQHLISRILMHLDQKVALLYSTITII